MTVRIPSALVADSFRSFIGTPVQPASMGARTYLRIASTDSSLRIYRPKRLRSIRERSIATLRSRGQVAGPPFAPSPDGLGQGSSSPASSASTNPTPSLIAGFHGGALDRVDGIPRRCGRQRSSPRWDPVHSHEARGAHARLGELGGVPCLPSGMRWASRRRAIPSASPLRATERRGLGVELDRAVEIREEEPELVGLVDAVHIEGEGRDRGELGRDARASRLWLRAGRLPRRRSSRRVSAWTPGPRPRRDARGRRALSRGRWPRMRGCRRHPACPPSKRSPRVARRGRSPGRRRRPRRAAPRAPARAATRKEASQSEAKAPIPPKSFRE